MTHSCPSNKSIIHQGKIITGCEVCLGQKINIGEYSAKGNREWQKGQYRKDIVQPNQPREFIKAHGADKAREQGYSEATIRKFG